MSFIKSDIKVIRQTMQPQPTFNTMWLKPVAGSVDEIYLCNGEFWSAIVTKSMIIDNQLSINSDNAIANKPVAIKINEHDSLLSGLRTDVDTNKNEIGYTKDFLRNRFESTRYGFKIKGSDDADIPVSLELNTQTKAPIYSVNGVEKQLALDEDVTKLEQTLSLTSKKPQGLRFKAGDNSVFAKTMKDLVLGTDDFTVCVVARTKGCKGSANPLIGFTKNIASQGSLIIYPVTENTNNITWVTFQGALVNQTSNYINVSKIDSTTNLHHIVVSRSGTIVTCVVNGRLVKSVTQDRVLDFSNFIYDMANTSYFWGGAVFNYVMTQAESNRLLWNGGRYDEVRLPEGLLTNYESFNNIPIKTTNSARFGETVVEKIDDNYRATAMSVGTESNIYSLQDIKCLPKSTSDNVIVTFYARAVSGNDPSICLNGGIGGFKNITLDSVFKKYRTILTTNPSWNGNIQFGISIGSTIEISVINTDTKKALLEYRPENIRDDRYLNSGTMGSEYDLVYSAVKPEIILDDPYEKVIVREDIDAPDFHPIAVGQECYTRNGNIFKAKLPINPNEWNVTDWKTL